MDWFPCEDCAVNGQGCREHGADVALPTIERLRKLAADAGDAAAGSWLDWLASTYDDGAEPGCGCSDGVLWPWSTDGDDSHDWIERCDDCARFETDDDAAAALAERLGVPVQSGWIESAGRLAPFIDQCAVCRRPVEPAARYVTDAGERRHLLCNQQGEGVN